MFRPRTIIWGAVIGLVFFLFASVSKAGATEPYHPPTHPTFGGGCAVNSRTDTSGILTTSNGEPVSPTNPPSSAIVKLGNGIDVELPDANAKAMFMGTLAHPQLLSAVRALSYTTWQLNPASVALPSLNLTIDYNGTLPGGFATLVYEPYQDGREIKLNQWQTWDALRGGQAKWWSTRPLDLLPGNADQAHPTAWHDILVAYPLARISAWGLNFGKGAPGAHARWGSVTFAYLDACVTIIWPTFHPPSPAPSGWPQPSYTPPSPTPSATPSPSATTPHPPSTPPPPSTTASPVPIGSSPGGAGGIGVGNTPPPALALTGSSTSWLFGVGTACVVAGAFLLLVLLLRRRRSFAA